MMRDLMAAAIIAGGVMAYSTAWASSSEAYLASTCANCHGTEGRAEPGMVSLAGRPSAVLRAAMHDFKAGARPATVMHQLAKGYTDAQIDQISDFFAQQARP